MTERTYDLEERLLEYAAQIVRLVEILPNTRAGNHIAGQLLRSGSSPLPNHGEAEGAESRNDFIHKLGICHKELRESRRWLLLIQRVPLLPETDRVPDALRETDELIRIFASSIRTARANSCREDSPPYSTELERSELSVKRGSQLGSPQKGVVMLYFAYGSNLCLPRLLSRVKSAQFVELAKRREEWSCRLQSIRPGMAMNGFAV